MCYALFIMDLHATTCVVINARPSAARWVLLPASGWAKVPAGDGWGMFVPVWTCTLLFGLLWLCVLWGWRRHLPLRWRPISSTGCSLQRFHQHRFFRVGRHRHAKVMQEHGGDLLDSEARGAVHANVLQLADGVGVVGLELLRRRSLCTPWSWRGPRSCRRG